MFYKILNREFPLRFDSLQCVAKKSLKFIKISRKKEDITFFKAMQQQNCHAVIGIRNESFMFLHPETKRITIIIIVISSITRI